MVWGVKGPGREAGKPGRREAGIPGSPDPGNPGSPDPGKPGSRGSREARIPGSREAGKPRSRSQILDFKGRGEISKGYPNVTAWGRGFKVFEGAGRAAGGSDTTPESPRSAHVLRHTPRQCAPHPQKYFVTGHRNTFFRGSKAHGRHCESRHLLVAMVGSVAVKGQVKPQTECRGVHENAHL